MFLEPRQVHSYAHNYTIHTRLSGRLALRYHATLWTTSAFAHRSDTVLAVSSSLHLRFWWHGRSCWGRPCAVCCQSRCGSGCFHRTSAATRCLCLASAMRCVTCARLDKDLGALSHACRKTYRFFMLVLEGSSSEVCPLSFGEFAVNFLRCASMYYIGNLSTFVFDL